MEVEHRLGRLIDNCGEFAVRDRVILSSPAKGIRLPKPRRTEMRILDPLDVELLSRALPDRYASLPIVAVYTGMRWGELAGLRVADINLLRRRLTIRSSLVEAAGQLPQLAQPSRRYPNVRSVFPGSSSTRSPAT
ncbi:MAG: hypothetical protein WAL25_08460 [Acidimicrobiia bacterium]